MNKRFVSSVVDFENSYAWILYDLSKEMIVEEVCDYAVAMVGKAQCSKLTLEQEMGYLRVFWSFLYEHALKIEQINDDLLLKFRDACFLKVINGPSHRGHHESAKATVNAKLIRVYDWLMWMQETQRIGRDSIGVSACAVTSSLETSSVINLKAKNLGLKNASRYPLIFRLKASKSKHRLRKYVPDESDLDGVHAYFFKKGGSPYVFHRNCVIADVAAYLGFRRASVQSLTINQFTGVEGVDFKRTAADTVLIQPARQKFSYGDIYAVPIWLHDAVINYINNYREPLVSKLGIVQKTHQNALFISSRTGRPLDDRTYSALMSQAMRSLGAPKGTSMHSWRTKFAVEETAEAYELRRDLGLDTSIATMDAIVSRKLGHRHANSARAYTSAYEAAEVARKRAQRSSERNVDKKRIQELEKELDEIKRINS